MELKFSNDSINLQVLREFCKQEGEAVVYRKGEQMEREGEPSKCLTLKKVDTIVNKNGENQKETEEIQSRRKNGDGEASLSRRRNKVNCQGDMIQHSLSYQELFINLRRRMIRARCL